MPIWSSLCEPCNNTVCRLFVVWFTFSILPDIKVFFSNIAIGIMEDNFLDGAWADEAIIDVERRLVKLTFRPAIVYPVWAGIRTCRPGQGTV
jgi:hypothetical protein